MDKFIASVTSLAGFLHVDVSNLDRFNQSLRQTKIENNQKLIHSQLWPCARDYIYGLMISATYEPVRIIMTSV